METINSILVQGMLKILEHVYSLLEDGRVISASEISKKTGLDKRHLVLLKQNRIIELVEMVGNKGRHKWTGIKPNIKMASELFKKIPIDQDIISSPAFDLKEKTKLSVNRNDLKWEFFEKYSSLCDIVFKNRDTGDWKIRTKYDHELANLARKEIGYSESTGSGDIICKLHKLWKTGNAHWDNETMEPVDHEDDFYKFWELYNKKEDKLKCIKEWNKLKKYERDLIFEKLPAYINATPDKIYRKNPLNYIKNKCWENEIITYIKPTFNDQKNISIENALRKATNEQLMSEIKRRGGEGEVTFKQKFEF